MSNMTNYERVKEFHERFGHLVNKTPNWPPEEVINLRLKLIEEECDELQVAIDNDDLVSIADALGDILYVVYDAALCFGINADAVVSEIHNSNMTKLGENGNPIRRADGKIMKGPQYRPPNIKGVLESTET